MPMRERAGAGASGDAPSEKHRVREWLYRLLRGYMDAPRGAGGTVSVGVLDANLTKLYDRLVMEFDAFIERTTSEAEAVTREREIAVVFMCSWCRRGASVSLSADGAQYVHHVNDGLQARGEPARVVGCGASDYRRQRAEAGAQRRQKGSR